jgi:hypothetical protein
MQWSEISWTPSSRTLRQFAALWLLALGGLACWHGLVRGHAMLGGVLAVLAVTVGPLGLIKPGAIRYVFICCQIVTFPIGWALSRVILACVYYGVFTPVGLVFKLIGRDALARRPRPDQPTYWESKPMATDMASYLRQF